MAETAPREDPLERQKDNREAISIIMELHNVDEAVATDLWHRFIGTVQKMKIIVREQNAQQG